MHLHGDYGLMKIHPTAIVHPAAELDPDVEIGPYAIVEKGVQCRAGVKIGPRAVLCEGLFLDHDVEVHAGAVLAGIPQDLKFKGQKSYLRIGAHSVIREYCTLNRAVEEEMATCIGNNTLIMAYVHVGHDCQIGEQVVLANRVQIGGHVQIGKGAVLGGCTAVHQFSKVGDYAFVGGTLKVDRDVPFASKALGDPLCWAGVNKLGLERAGFTLEQILHIEDIYRQIFCQSTPIRKSLESLSLQADPWASVIARCFLDSTHGTISRKKKAT